MKAKDKSHPFQVILYNKNEDFLENDNFYMNCITQLLCNIILGVFVSSVFDLKYNLPDEVFNFHNIHSYINRPLEIIGLLVWLKLIWHGNTDDKFFNSK